MSLQSAVESLGVCTRVSSTAWESRPESRVQEGDVIRVRVIVGLRIRVIVRYTQYTRYSRRYTRHGQCSRLFYYWQQYLSSTRPYVQREVKAFHWVNLYPVDKNAIYSPSSYPLNSDLSGGKLKCYGQV